MALRERGMVGRKPEWQGPWPLLEGFKAERGAERAVAGETPEEKRGRRAYRALTARQREQGAKAPEGKR